MLLADREDALYSEYDERHEAYLRGATPRSQRGTVSSKLCGKQAWMGACAGFDFCRVGGPNMERLDWPMVMAGGEPSEEARKRLPVLEAGVFDGDSDPGSDLPF